MLAQSRFASGLVGSVTMGSCARTHPLAHAGPADLAQSRKSALAEVWADKQALRR
jgi:hypothetical protein